MNSALPLTTPLYIWTSYASGSCADHPAMARVIEYDQTGEDLCATIAACKHTTYHPSPHMTPKCIGARKARVHAKLFFGRLP